MRRATLLLVLLLLPIVAGQLVEKTTFSIGEPVFINTTDESGRVIVHAPEGKYRLLDEPGTDVAFVPRTAGNYTVALQDDTGATLTTETFTVEQGEPQPETRTITTSEPAVVGQDVMISVTPTPESNVRMTIDAPGGTFRYFGPWADSPFTPNGPGRHEIILMEDDVVTARHEFVVEEPAEQTATDPPPEPVNDTVPDPEREEPPVSFDIIDSEGRRTVPDIKVLARRGSRADVELRMPGKGWRMLLRNVSTNTTAVRIDSVPAEGTVGKQQVIDKYAIDLGGVEFTDGTFTKVARGHALWKCKLWDFATQTCNGTWERVMDITPGQQYSIPVFPGDPGYAETGVATVNTRKPIYRPGETAELIMVVLDTNGFLVSGADVTLDITDPNNSTTTVSNIIETEKGIYEASHPVTIEGTYLLDVTAIAKNVNSTMSSSFLVRESYEFDIIRDTPVTTDPFKGPFTSSIRLTAYVDADTFTCTEVLPSSFTVTEAGNATVTTSGNETRLTWTGLTNNSVVNYTAQPPKVTPDLHALGQAEITYGNETFTEARQWWLAIDPADGFNGSFYLLWENTTSIPVNWTCVSCQSGDDFYQRLIRGNDTFGDTGGADWHNHTPTLEGHTDGAGELARNQGTAMVTETHTHPASNYSVGNVSNLPAYKELLVISHQGVPDTIPAGAIGFFDTSALPAGWTRYSAADNRFIRGENGTATGGADTHDHDVSFTLAASADTVTAEVAAVDSPATTHTHNVSGTSADTDHKPPYVGIVLARADSDTQVPNAQGFIAMFNETPNTTQWDVVSNASGDLYGRFVRGSSSYGGTGGSETHTHGNLLANSSVPNGAFDDHSTNAPTLNIATTDHFHETNTSFSTDSHLPPYIDVIFATAVNIPQAASINEIQCMENDAWTACGDILYGDTLQAVRANCTSSDPIENVTFRFDNVPDGTTYFTANATYNVSDHWVYNNTDITLNQSGLHRMTVTCYADGSSQLSESWTIPWGDLLVTWLTPTTNDNTTRHLFRTFSVNVSCSGGECGDVNATLDPITVGNPANATPETANVIDNAGDDEQDGGVTDTRGDDNSYLSIGETDNNLPADSLINLSYNISALGISEAQITEINFTITYCHSGDDTAPDCNGGTGAEKSFSGSQDIFAYNFSSGTYVDIGDLSTTNDENEETVTVQLTKGLTDFVNDDDLLYFEVELVTASGGANDDAWLAVEEAVAWITYTTDPLSKGIISTNVGDTPFYTTDSNPQNASDAACLLDMISGGWCQVSWAVNATGDANVTWEFFAYANSTDNDNGVGRDETPHINITIVENTAPDVTSITLTPTIPATSQNLTCDITVVDPNSQDTLTANVTWYRNDVYFTSTLETVSSGVSHDVILGSGNTTPGETWICGATPTDQIASGPQVNSSSVTILAALPPSLNGFQCYENSTVWTDCTNLVFGDTFGGVRANCTGPENDVSNVTFNFTNEPDGNFFVNVSTNNSGDFWYYFETIPMDDSGTFTMNVTCEDNASVTVQDSTSWFLPWGVLSSQLIDPFEDVTVEQNVFFTFTARVDCTGGECGDVNATLDPISSGNPANATSEAGVIIDVDGDDEEGGTHTNTHGDDGSFYAMGETGSGNEVANSQMNLTYDISAVGAVSGITEINWTITYCHSGDDTAPDCNGDTPIEKGFSGTQDVFVYNFTSGGWVDIGDLDTTNGENEVTDTYQITSGFSDIVSNGIMYFSTEIVTDNANGDAWFAMEQAVVWITQDKKDGAISTVIGDTPFYTTDSNPQNASDEACLGTMISGDSCQVSWDVNATGAVGTVHEFFVDWNLTTNREDVGDNATEIINITIQNSNLVPPVVRHISPANNTFTNSSNVDIVCNATDNNGLANISLYADFSGSWVFDETNNVTGTSNTTTFNKALSDGEYLWACRAEDINNNVDWLASNWTFTVDTVRPTINLTQPQNGTNFTDGTIEFNFTITEAFDAQPLCNLTIDSTVRDENFLASNSSVTNRTVTGLAQGTHLWNVTCVDEAGNVNTSVTWEFDIIDLPPNGTLLDPPNGTIQSATTILLYYNATDNNNVTLARLMLDGVNTQNSTDVRDGERNNFTVTGLSEGFYNWTVNVSDISGLWDQPAVRYFTIDFTPPDITLNAPPDLFNTTNSTILFNWTAIDNFDDVMECNVTIDSTVRAANVSTANDTATTQNIVNLTDGTHDWNVTCVDDAGNTNTSLTRQFNVSEPPTVTLNEPDVNASLSQIEVNFTYIPRDNTNLTSCELYIDDAFNQTNQTPVTKDVQNNFTVSSFDEGTYNWTVECTDTIGLRQNATTRYFTIDRTLPTINLSLPADGAFETGPTVNFSYTPTDNLDAFLDCNITVNGTVNDTFSAPNGTLTARLVNLTSEGFHVWNVTCVDDAGNANTSETRNFTLAQPPVVELNEPSDGTLFTENNVTLVYYTEDNTGLANSSLYVNGVFNKTNQSPIINFDVNEFDLSNLADGTYNWTVFVTDIDDLTTQSEVWEFSIDTRPPVVTLISPNESDVIATNNVTFNFTVTDLTDLTLICNITRNQTVTFSNLSVANGTYHIENELLTDGNYNWSVTCVDDANRTTTAGPVNFTVDAPPDVTLNTPLPEYRSANQTVLFNYTPIDPFGFENCSLVINAETNVTNSSINENIDNNFTVSTFSDGSYNWTVSCLDNDLNEFAPANRTFHIDLSGPVLNLTNPPEGAALNNNTVTFNWTAVDFNSSVLVTCNITLDDAVNQTGISEFSGSNFNTTIVNLTDGPHNWSVTCVDDLGNAATSFTGNFSINQPDLAMRNITFNDTNPAVGDTLNITANVSNTGGIAATDANVSFWDGDPAAGGIFIGSDVRTVPFNTSVLFNVSWVITRGFHTIHVSADPLNEIGEENETNNNGTTTISAIHVNVTHPANDTLTSDSTPRVDFNISDFTGNNLTYRFYVDGSFNGQTDDVADLSNNTINLSTLADGYRRIVLEGEDALGRRRNSSALTIRVDTTAPNTAFLTANATWHPDGNVTVEFNSTDQFSTTITYDVFLDSVLNQSNTTTNGSLANASFTDVPEGRHEVIVQATDELGNTGNSTALVFYVDLTPPEPNITTLNDSWFNTSTPGISFNITDNLDAILNYSFFADDVKNQNGTVPNATETTVNLLTLTEGVHTLLLQGLDEAGNAQNSTRKTINIDLTSPNVTLLYPANDTSLNTTDTELNFTVTDNMAPSVTCNVTLDSSVVDTNVDVTNGTNHSTPVSDLSSGDHFWNVTCVDIAGNHFTSETWQFFVETPDLAITAGNITFSNSTPAENDTVEVNATIFNIGNLDAENVTVQFWLGDPDAGGVQINGNRTISRLNASDNATVTVNHSAVIGTNRIYVVVDPPTATNGSIEEGNESNNKANRNFLVGLFQTFGGGSTNDLEIADANVVAAYRWNVSNVTGSNVFVADTDSSLSFTDLVAIGLNTTNGTGVGSDDFEEIDNVMNTSDLNDSVNLTFTSSGSPVGFMNITAFKRDIIQIPVVNSSNTSSFKTGILWDSSDTNPGFYNTSQDIAFVTVMNESKQGQYGVYDYEIRIPATLRDYIAGGGTVTFYTELR